GPHAAAAARVDLSLSPRPAQEGSSESPSIRRRDAGRNLMTSRTWLASSGLLIVLWPAIARADFQQGVEDYQRGDYSAAYQEFLSAAQQGDGSAAHALGFLYLTGRGVAQDNGQAIEWYRKGAELGFGEAPPAGERRRRASAAGPRPLY